MENRCGENSARRVHVICWWGQWRQSPSLTCVCECVRCVSVAAVTLPNFCHPARCIFLGSSCVAYSSSNTGFFFFFKYFFNRETPTFFFSGLAARTVFGSRCHATVWPVDDDDQDDGDDSSARSLSSMLTRPKWPAVQVVSCVGKSLLLLLLFFQCVCFFFFQEKKRHGACGARQPFLANLWLVFW